MNHKGISFLLFFCISLAVHAISLFALALPKNGVSQPAPNKLIEVAYQQTAEAAYRQTAPAKAEKNPPIPHPQKKDAGLPRDAARRAFAKEEILRSLKEKNSPIMEHKIVTLPNIPGEVFKTPEYKDYYHAVREKIRRLAYAYYKKPEEGKVFLTFVLDADGKLQSAVINAQKSTANPYLSEIAEMSVRDASPFPPFPEKLKNNKILSFNVIISFELK